MPRALVKKRGAMRNRKPRGAADGFALLEIAIAALLVTLGAIWMASRISADVHDAGARATASYLLNVRGAVHELLVQHFDVLTGYAEGDSTVPEYLAQPLPLNITVDNLRSSRAAGQAAYLASGFPAAPVYGGEAHVRVWREGVCPGEGCRLDAMVYTSEPLRAEPGSDYSPELVGAFMLAAQGYGGHAPPNDPGRIRGAVFDVPNPMGSVPGVVGVSASLDATLFHQFVRHNDTRPVKLLNSLDVVGTIATMSGLALLTNVSPGDGCAVEGMYASTNRSSMAVCQTGIWFELTRYVVHGVADDLPHGAALPVPVCPNNMEGFVHVALQSFDLTLDGGDIDVRGALEGTVSGEGVVGQNGNVSVSGSLEGTVYSTADSRIHIQHSIDASTGYVDLGHAGPNARAFAIYGCRHV